MESVKFVQGVFVALFLAITSCSLGAEVSIAVQRTPGNSSLPNCAVAVNKNLSEIQACCSQFQQDYYSEWNTGSQKLTSYLETLQKWNCREFGEECVNQTFSFTPFSAMVYKRFCNESNFRKECSKTLENLSRDEAKPLNFSWNDKYWTKLVMHLSNITTENNFFYDPCVQVAMYDIQGKEHYHEIINIIVPFCGFVWCGTTSYIDDYDQVSDWTCFSSMCRANQIVLLVFCVTMSVLVITNNVLVIFVFKKSSNKSRNSQTVYKLSIAVADLLVGLIVFPTFISTAHLYFLQKHQRPDGVHQDNATESNLYFTLSERASTAYYSFVGFITTVSLIVSVYTLMAASFDRLMVVIKPLRYMKYNSKRIARYVVTAIWFLSIIFASVPLFGFEDLKYTVVASTLISMSGEHALIIYAVGFLIPLIVVWITSLTTYISMKRQSSVIKSFEITHNKRVKNEKRLAVTLLLMVGVFSLCIIPAIIVAVIAIAMQEAQYKNPSEMNESTASALISAEFVAVVILLSNSLWNCFIYSVRNKDFRIEANSIFIRTTTKRYTISS